MTLAMGTGSGKESGNPLDDVIQHLDCLEELVHIVTSDLHDVKAQQTVMGVSMIRLEQQVPKVGDSTSSLHMPPDGQMPPTSNSSMAPPYASGHGCQQDQGW
jgi:hypothetical protein